VSVEAPRNRYLEQERGLERRLTTWQLGMIAIGGAIGVGLFLGSGATIGIAGPGVVLTYLLGSVVALILGYALAEMATVHPVAGAFGVYAERYLSPWVGFVVRVTYWFAQTLGNGAEVTAIGLYFGFWFPETPGWIWVAASTLVVVLVNALNVKRFGEIESLFAVVKVIAILAFILLGAGLILGFGGRPAIGFSNLTAAGGFLPHGFRGVFLALTLAITGFIGIETVAVAAGEAKRPEYSVPRALRTLVLRLILFYVLAVGVIVTLSPWTAIAQQGRDLSGSPFVFVFREVGIPFAGGLMNFVVVSAALSAVNTNLYLSTRMLFSLARGGYVPSRLGVVDRRGVPLTALAGSSLGMLAAIALAIAGQRAFLLLYGTAVAAVLATWMVILVTHLRFRRALSPERLAGLPVRLPFHPIPSLLGIVALVGIAASTPFVPGLEWTFPLFGLWLLPVSLYYFLRSRLRLS
jgi:L-asparagine transporter-like permease